MERNERIRLESVRKQLAKNLRLLDHLLQTAQPPKRLSDADIRKRAAIICRELAALRRPASQEQLRSIVSKHGMPYTAVGALYAGDYLRSTSQGIVLGPRGMAVLRSSARAIR